MARIVLTEQQFKDYCRRLLKEDRKKEYVKKLLNESLQEDTALASLCDNIEEEFGNEMIDAEVSRGYSSEGVIVVVTSDIERRNDIDNVMARFGYSLYDTGSSGAKMMLDYRPSEVQ